MPSINKQQVAQCFGKARWSYDQHAVAQQQIIQRLVALLTAQKTEFERVLEIGCGTGMLSQQLITQFNIQQLVLNDLCADYQDCLAQKLPAERISYQFGDAEQCDFAGEFDLIISASTFQWFENPAKFLQKAVKMLKNDGILLFNSFSERNLHQIRRLLKTGLYYPSEAEWRTDLEQAGFELIMFEKNEIMLEFAGIEAVFAHLNKTGVSAVDGMSWSEPRRAKLEYRYQQLCQTEQLQLSYTPCYVLARKKSEG